MFSGRKKSIIMFLLIFLLLAAAVQVCVYTLLTVAGQKARVPRKFGATYMTLDNLYFDVLNSAIEEVVESNGDLLITRDPSSRQDKQNEEIHDMLDMGVELIFVNPVDWFGVTPALQECKDRGVPCIVVDTDVFQDELAVSIIQSDNYDAGVQIGRDIISKKTDAKIVVLYDKRIDSTDRRLQGMLDTITASRMQYEIVYTASGTTLLQQTMGVMQEFLETGTFFDVVFGGNDPAALGALAAIQKKHLTRPVLVYGVDGSPSGKTMVMQGYMEGTSAQFPQIMGKKAAETAYAYLEGTPVEHRITMPVQLITRQNLSDFNVLGWQ